MTARWVGAAITLVALWALVALAASALLLPLVSSVGPREAPGIAVWEPGVTPTTYGPPGPTGGPAR